MARRPHIDLSRLQAPLRGLGLRPRQPSRPGAPPGTLEPAEPAPARVSVIQYTVDTFDEARDIPVADALARVAPDRVTWINVDGVADVQVLKAIAAHFDLHPLLLEDVCQSHQRPKAEAYPGILFLVTRMAHIGTNGEALLEQVSLVLAENVVITFQDAPGDVFDPVRQRIRQGQGRIRGVGPDYLLYRLLDAIVDGYFPVLDALAGRLERLQEEAYADPSPRTQQSVQEVRRTLLAIRHAVWPARDAVNTLVRDPHPLIQEGTHVFLRDVYDHIVQLVDLLQTYQELASGAMESYMSSVSHRMNEVMKVLTIIATIFIPLSFVVGLYGMNFDTSYAWNMPELSQPYGYPVLLGVMLTISVGMLAYFRRKRWL